MKAFGPDTLAFLTDLRANNDSAWFDANRERYREAYVEPAKAFVEAVAPLLADIAPGVSATPRIQGGSILRVNRDTRFSKDKRPYKDHLDMWFWEGERKAAVSGFAVRLSPDVLGIGGGAHHFDKHQLERFRAAVTDPAKGVRLVEIAAELGTLGGRRYTRTPRGWDADGPAGAFLLHDGLHAYESHPPELALDPDRLLPTVRATWTRLAPLHRWLVENL